MRKRRAEAMLRCMRQDQSDEELLKFFCLCLRAHELDTLKEVMQYGNETTKRKRG